LHVGVCTQSHFSTSLDHRSAIKTAWLALEEMDQLYVPCAATWELNERMYGLVSRSLTASYPTVASSPPPHTDPHHHSPPAQAGRTEAEAVAEFGRARVDQWAASFDEAPPPVAEGGPTDPATDTRKYASLGHAPPRTESLKDTMARASG
jgi:2,3-bisphosphoglycerate-dependent phosphoglycerate mutase